MNICYIACALDAELDFIRDEKDLVIGADRGYLNLKRCQIEPDVVIGDFDSYKGEVLCENILRLPTVKDETDCEAAIKYAIEKGYKHIIIYGAIGGALDHTIANIAHLRGYTEKGMRVEYIDGENVLFAINSSKIDFSSSANGRISIFSASEMSTGVNIKGLYYELSNATLYNSIPLGVSNEFVSKEGMISVEKGTLYIYTSKKNCKNILTNS